MHDVADSSSDYDHLPTISLAHTYNATQAPVSVISIAFKEQEELLVIFHQSFLLSLIFGFITEAQKKQINSFPFEVYTNKNVSNFNWQHI